MSNGSGGEAEHAARTDRLLEAIAKASLELTDKERRCLEYYSRGLNRTMVAAAMHYAPETIRGHFEMARIKLGCKTICHAACEAIRRGIIN